MRVHERPPHHQHLLSPLVLCVQVLNRRVVQELNRLIKQFDEMKKMMKSLTRMKKKGRTPEMFRGGIQ